MRYPDAIWRPGPAWKVNDAPLAPRGVVCHSAVGYEAGLYAVLDGPTRASWHFSVLYDGIVLQHYETTAQTWHAQAADAFTVGIEHEGGYDPEDEPLRPAQLAASVALVRWLGQELGFALSRADGPEKSLWEHNEFYAKPCPSGRIPWERYTEEDEMTPEEVDAAIEAKIAAALGYRDGAGTPGTGGWYREEAAAWQEAHVRDFHGPGATPEHEHEPGRVRR